MHINFKNKRFRVILEFQRLENSESVSVLFVLFVSIFYTFIVNSTKLYCPRGRTHGALYYGHGYGPLRFVGNVVMRMGIQQQQILPHWSTINL